jgi:DNA mismatch repair protein MutS2
MPFSPGTRVIVVPLGRKQGVVVEAGRGGHYRVQVENTAVSCRETDLIASPGVPRKTRAARGAVRTSAGDETAGAVAPTIDLHGLTVEEALARVVEAIDTALQRGADRLEVVHGKGSGRIRQALHRQLEKLTVVASFTLDPRNPGVTWVYF